MKEGAGFGFGVLVLFVLALVDALMGNKKTK